MATLLVYLLWSIRSYRRTNRQNKLSALIVDKAGVQREATAMERKREALQLPV